MNEKKEKCVVSKSLILLASVLYPPITVLYSSRSLVGLIPKHRQFKQGVLGLNPGDFSSDINHVFTAN